MAPWREKNVSNGSSLQVSNIDVPISEGVSCFRDFLSPEEESHILSLIDRKSFGWWEGFDQRRRVQRFNFAETDCDDSNGLRVMHRLNAVRHRLHTRLGLHFTHASIEEVLPETFPDVANQIVSTFESACQNKDCETCCVALLPLESDAVAHWNRPRRRQAMCWSLESPDHQTNVLLQRGSVCVRCAEHLHFWRSRIVSAEKSPSLILKFYSLAENCESSITEPDSFGYVATDIPSTDLTRTIPPLEDVLTILVTTSPIKSNPSTELLEKVFATFRFAGERFSVKCRKIILCDGCRQQDGCDESVSRRHQNVKQAMRSGIVTPSQAENYELYKANLRNLCSNASADSPFHNTTVEELNERHGFGYALRYALRSLVRTKYVCVIQHDRTFMRSTPVEEAVRVMWNNPAVKYIGFSMRSNLCYRDIFYSKYGRHYSNEYDEMTLRPPELRFDSALYGPDSASCREALEAHPQLQENLMAQACKYQDTSQCAEQEEWMRMHPANHGEHQMTLSPTLFWYDNIHIAETSHYRDFIFNSSYKMVSRGGFVEEGVLPVLKKTLDRLGLREGHRRFGCFLLDDHSGYFFTGHLDGGSYIPEDLRYNAQKALL